MNSESLSSINIPENITSIGANAFDGCAFTSISIPTSVTTIGKGAFRRCYKLTSFTIPSSVTSIGEIAFQGLLTPIYCYAINLDPTSIKNINGESDYNKLYIPQSSYNYFYENSSKPGLVFAFASTPAIGWSTGCLPYDAIVPEGVKAYYVSAVTESKVTLKEFENNIIPANQGFIINAPTETTHALEKATTAVPTITNLLVGTTAETTVAANSVYALGKINENTVGLLTYTGTTIAANKAYLPKSSLTTECNEALFINIEGNTTGIEEIKAEAEAPIYNLFGQRVTTLNKGQIYIKNNRKFLYK